MKRDSVKFCSNITEVVAQMLIGHALGPKEAFLDQVKQSKSHNIGLKATLETCSVCPKALFPFHLTPYTKLTCKAGPFHKQMIDEVYHEPPKLCPESCLSREADWSFPSQSDTVYIWQCVYD